MRLRASRLGLRQVAMLLGLTACGDSVAPPPGGPAVALGVVFADPGAMAQDEATDVLLAPSGEILVAGYTGGVFGASSVEPGGDAVGIVYAFADRGDALELTKTLRLGDGNGTAEVIEALASRDGVLYIAGRTTGVVTSTDPSCTTAPENAGQYDLFVGSISMVSDDARRCLLQTGSNRPQHPRHLEVTSTGELIVAGYDDIYVPSNFVEAWENPFVTRARHEGEHITIEPGWPLVYDTTASDVLGGLAVEPTAGAPIYFTTSTASGSGRGVEIVKLGSSKEMLWSSRVSTLGADSGAAVHRLADGDVLFVGTTYGRLGDTAYGEQDVMVRRMGPDQVVRWTKQYGTSRSDLAVDLAVSADGSIYILGETLGSFSPDIINDGQQADVFVLRLDADGNQAAAYQLAAPGDERATALAVGQEGRVYVAGSTTGPMFGSEHQGERDGFVLRLLDAAFESVPPAP